MSAATAPAPSSLERTASTLATRLAEGPLEPPLALVVEGPAPLAHALSALLSSRLAEAHRAPMVLEPPPGASAETLARQAGARSLARLTVSVDAGRLAVRGDGFSTWVNFWAGATPTRAPGAAVFALDEDADAEVRLLAGAPPLPLPPQATGLSLTLTPLTTLAAEPTALASGDLDGDGKPEVAALVGEVVVVLSATGQLLVREDLADHPLAPLATRGAFGGLAIVGAPPRLVVWSNRHARAETLSWSGGALRTVGTAETMTIEGLVLRLDPGLNRFQGEVGWSGRPVSLGSPLQAVSSRGGATLLLLPDGTGAIVRGTPLPPRRLGGLGVAGALVDLDADGTLEVVATTARTVGDGDEVRVLPLTTFEEGQTRGAALAELPGPWQRSTRARLTAACTVDLDGDGKEEVLLGGALPDGRGELLHLTRSTP